MTAVVETGCLYSKWGLTAAKGNGADSCWPVTSERTRNSQSAASGDAPGSSSTVAVAAGSARYCPTSVYLTPMDGALLRAVTEKPVRAACSMQRCKVAADQDDQRQKAGWRRRCKPLAES